MTYRYIACNKSIKTQECIDIAFAIQSRHSSFVDYKTAPSYKPLYVQIINDLLRRAVSDTMFDQ